MKQAQFIILHPDHVIIIATLIRLLVRITYFAKSE